MYRKYKKKLIIKIINEIENGVKKTTLSKLYGVPYSTISYWYKTREKIKKDKKLKISNINSNSYSYILGIYLGDGYIDKMLRTYRLRIYLDSRQDLVIEECINNLNILFPSNKVNIIKTKFNYVIITIYSNNLNILFPYIGKGKKNERKIFLNDEQRKILNYNLLMKGLFHSDGSYFVALSKYPRYQFTNRSENLIEIFSECMIRNGITPRIRKRKNGIYDIQIQNKNDVGIMYNIVGEKYKNK